MGSDWMMFQYNASHVGCQLDGVGHFEYPRVLWVCRVGGFVVTQPLVADLNGDGTREVLVCTWNLTNFSKSIYCISAEGQVLWQHQDLVDAARGIVPAISDLNADGNLEIVTAYDNRVYCVSGSGNVLWNCTLNVTFTTASPVVGDVNVDGLQEILVGGYRRLYCIDSKGVILWWLNMWIEARDCPALGDINNDGIPEVLVTSGCNVLCLDSKGHLKWNSTLPYKASTTPALIGQKHRGSLDVIVGCGRRICCLNASGYVTWISPELGDFSISRALAAADIDHDGNIELLAVTDDIVFCLSVNGTIRWSYTLPRVFRFETEFKGTAPVVADVNNDTLLEVLVGDTRGHIFCIGSDGTLLWSFKVESSIMAPPSVADINGDGILEVIFGTKDGSVYCLHGTPKPLWLYLTSGLTRLFSQLKGTIAVLLGSSCVAVLLVALPFVVELRRRLTAAQGSHLSLYERLRPLGS